MGKGKMFKERNLNEVDKLFDVKTYLEKQLRATLDFTGKEDEFIVTNSIQATYDGIRVKLKALTDAEADMVIGECFSKVDEYYREGKEQTPTELIMLVKGCSYKQAINIGKKLIKNDYEEVKQEQRQDFIVSQNGNPLKIWENLKRLYDMKGIELKYNELKQIIESNQEWYQYDDFITVMNTECILNGFKLTKDNMYDFNAHIAHINAYNPVKQYLDKCYEAYKKEKPNHSYIEDLFNTITFSDKYTAEEIEFNKKMFVKWLMTGAKLANNDGSLNAEFILILKGVQGKGKTRWFRALMPKQYQKEFFKDGEQLNPTNKDNVAQLIKYWLVELGEIGATMKKSDRDSLKAWITSPSDEYRSPYARKAEKYPRRTFICGTVNDNEFLRDETGNRRFIVMDIAKLNHTHNVDIDMMWGEVMSLLEFSNINTYLDDEEIETLNKRNRGYLVKSNEQLLIEECLPDTKEVGYITAAALSKYINDNSSHKLEPRKIGKALKCMGYDVSEPKRIGGCLGRYYKLPFINGYSIPF